MTAPAPSAREKKILAWHFLAEGGIARDGTQIRPGYIYTTDEPRIAPCESGLHASVHPFDALNYAPGPVLCRVRLWGEVAEHGNPPDKIVARHREVLWMRDVSRELRLFACWCVRNTPLTDGRKTWDLLTDERSKRAVTVAEQYAIGKATSEELAAAWAAAWDAAWGTQRTKFARICGAIDRRERRRYA